MRSLYRSLALAASLLAPSLRAESSPQLASYSPKSVSDVSFAVSVPSSTTSSNGDLYFQIKAPSTYSWVALGQGNSMTGSRIFILYTSASGDNVTISGRKGEGHRMPMVDPDTQVALLEGSGVENGVMTANVRCSSCATWDGGQRQMDLTSSNTAWIWAYKEGSPLNSDDTSARIAVHDGKDRITLDLSKAQGGDTLNPFVAAAASGSASNPTATNTAGVAGSTSVPSSSKSQGENEPVNGASGSGMLKEHRILIAHGVLMSLAFVIFFPLGAILVRVLSLNSTAWIHSGTQFFAFLLAIAGMGLGVWITTQGPSIDSYHPIIGLTVLSAIFIQLLLGHAHHFIQKKRIAAGKSERSIITYIHIYWGRAAVTLGIINGGLGLMWADNTKSGEIAYGVIAGIIWVVWIGIGIWRELRRSRGRGGSQTGLVEKGGSQASRSS